MERITLVWADKFRELIDEIRRSKAYRDEEKDVIFRAVRPYIKYMDKKEKQVDEWFKDSVNSVEKSSRKH
jgi:hypothetical protein